MKIIVEMDFDYDSIGDELDTEFFNQLSVALEFGADSTCSEIKLHKVIKAEDAVTITAIEYQNMLESQEELECLQACGVDNWSGYSDAMRIKAGEDIWE